MKFDNDYESLRCFSCLVSRKRGREKCDNYNMTIAIETMKRRKNKKKTEKLTSSMVCRNSLLCLAWWIFGRITECDEKSSLLVGKLFIFVVVLAPVTYLLLWLLLVVLVVEADVDGDNADEEDK